METRLLPLDFSSKLILEPGSGSNLFKSKQPVLLLATSELMTDGDLSRIRIVNAKNHKI